MYKIFHILGMAGNWRDALDRALQGFKNLVNQNLQILKNQLYGG
jgi:hypothetical protein